MTGEHRFGEKQLEKVVLAALALAFGLFFARHLGVLYREGVNWDEFALFSRVLEIHETNVFTTGGRPGLVSLFLLPLLENCSDIIESALQARRVWLLFSLGYPVALFLFLARAFRARSGLSGQGSAPLVDAGVATALLVWTPLFFRWSVQVRTDQPALFFVLLSGWLALDRRPRSSLSLASGAMAGLGILCTPKGLYAGLLVATFVLAQLLHRGLEPRRELRRLGLFFLGVIASYGLYQAALLSFEAGATTNLDHATKELESYRRGLGTGFFWALLSLCIPHLFLSLGVVVGTLNYRRLDSRTRNFLWVSWALAAEMVLVGWVHGSRFGYFWLTFGLFPVVLAGLGLGFLREQLGAKRRVQSLVLALVVLCFVLVFGEKRARSALSDGLGEQRKTLSFVERNFRKSQRGFQVEGALHCREGQVSFPAFLTTRIRKMPQEESEGATAELLESFRSLPVTFLVSSYRMRAFPEVVQQFWRQHYVHYFREVHVAGSRVLPGETEIELIVAGDYAWRATGGVRSVAVIDGVELEDGQKRTLEAGVVSVQSTGPGVLALSLEEQPAPTGQRFYSLETVRDLN